MKKYIITSLLSLLACGTAFSEAASSSKGKKKTSEKRDVPAGVQLVTTEKDRTTAEQAVVVAALKKEFLAMDSSRYTESVFKDSETDTEMRYVLFYPLGYDAKGDKKYPLVTTLHGNGARKPEMDFDDIISRSVGPLVLAGESQQQKHPCFVLVPKTATPWGLNSDVGVDFGKPKKIVTEPRRGEDSTPVVIRLIESITSTHSGVDTDRLYILGQSMGARGTYHAIIHYPDLFAAAIPVVGIMQPENAARITTPTWIFTGRHDQKNSNHHDIYRAIKGNGTEVKMTEFTTLGHNCHEQTFRQPGIWEWLFSHSLSTK